MLSGVLVSLIDLEKGSQLEVTTTDNKGRFAFLPVEREVLLKFNLDGYRLASNNLGLQIRTLGNGESALLLEQGEIKDLTVELIKV